MFEVKQEDDSLVIDHGTEFAAPFTNGDVVRVIGREVDVITTVNGFPLRESFIGADLGTYYRSILEVSDALPSHPTHIVLEGV